MCLNVESHKRTWDKKEKWGNVLQYILFSISDSIKQYEGHRKHNTFEEITYAFNFLIKILSKETRLENLRLKKWERKVRDDGTIIDFLGGIYIFPLLLLFKQRFWNWIGPSWVGLCFRTESQSSLRNIVLNKRTTQWTIPTKWIIV
jgi:hypothetical protein